MSAPSVGEGGSLFNFVCCCWPLDLSFLPPSPDTFHLNMLLLLLVSRQFIFLFSIKYFSRCRHGGHMLPARAPAGNCGPRAWCRDPRRARWRCRHYYRLLQVAGYWYSADNAESLSVRRSSKEGCKQRCLDIRNETDNRHCEWFTEQICMQLQSMHATTKHVCNFCFDQLSVLELLLSKPKRRQGSLLTDEIKTICGPNVYNVSSYLVFTVLCGMLVAGLLAVVPWSDHKHQSATSISPVSWPRPAQHCSQPFLCFLR